MEKVVISSIQAKGLNVLNSREVAKDKNVYYIVGVEIILKFLLLINNSIVIFFINKRLNAS